MPEPDEPRHLTVLFQPLGRRIRARRGSSLLAAAHDAGVALLSVCGGAGLCHSCRVRVVAGEVSPVSAIERERLDAGEIARGFRLSCQVTLAGDTVVDVPVESMGTEQRIQLEWNPRLDDGGGEPRAHSGRLGLAVDVGTTKIAAYLVDLDTARTLAAAGAMNPQVTCGEDLISRIAYADRTPDGAAHLHRLAIGAINELVGQLCADADVGRSAIQDAVLVGNTVMHHLVAGLPVASLGRSPYAPVVTGALELPAAQIDLDLGPKASAYLPPNIAGYVGADHVAVLVALGEHERRGPTTTHLSIDIGTNTEVTLRVGDRLWSCSCASGPAFEGAHISQGMRAAAGAIERVRVVGDAARCRTIGDVPPIGICGSGVLDAVAELVAHGAVDRHGGFRRGHPLVSDAGGDRVFVLATATATGHNRDLCLTRRDVSEIQLAKAAIRTGIEILLARAGVAADAIDLFTVAGAFGSYLDLASARRIGLLPDLPAGRFRQVGNAAGAGARKMVVDRRLRHAAEDVAARAEHVDLTSDARFTQVFASEVGFPVPS